MQIDGTSALVTGAASGLGLATARRLVSCGARVVLVDLPSSPGPDVAKELGGSTTFVAADILDTEQFVAALDAAQETAL